MHITMFEGAALDNCFNSEEYGSHCLNNFLRGTGLGTEIKHFEFIECYCNDGESEDIWLTDQGTQNLEIDMVN
jgi:hypothetical protein